MTHFRSAAFLFGKSAQARLADFVDPVTLFAFDLDGTLAPIVSDPALVRVPDAVERALAELAGRAPVAIITGRSRSDALAHLESPPRYVIGNHGAEGLPGWAERENDFVRTAQGWQQQLDILLPQEEQTGIVIENKGPTLSIHYRRAVNIPAAQGLVLHAVRRLLPPPRRVSGKFVENLLPDGAPDKGVALELLMRRENLAKAFFVGDDETDEDIFRLGRKNIFTVRVGQKETSGAGFYLRGQYEMAGLLRLLNRLLKRF
ncbi:MAG: trehalose-phosphatase [Smithellaceae bacterium]|nr:trehalose-phosphatase [Syntrophaceae bacterium]MDD4240676.1 trehalose-phosphatase [Smithellaceae bacterium]NLX52817.1 trehalose-phosphatase [Deltaproteobacteria bacterium]